MKTIITIVFFLLSLIQAHGQKPTESLKITPLTDDFYVFTTYQSYKGTLFPANGMYVITEKGAVLFDSPWDKTQFQPLLDSIKTKHNKDVIMCIATHSHEDRTGGLEFYRQKGIKTYTTKQTDSISAIREEKRAEFLIEKDTVFNIGQHSFQTFYAGPGHTPDNIVIWFNKEKILYGGCLIKSTDASDLGYLGDANVKEWPKSIKKIEHKFGKPKYILPGHQSWKSKNALKHTLKLIKQHEAKVK